jgi:hypothetical protein
MSLLSIQPPKSGDQVSAVKNVFTLSLMVVCRGSKQNDIQQKDSQHNDTQHNNKKSDIEHFDTQHDAGHCYAECQ